MNKTIKDELKFSGHLIQPTKGTSMLPMLTENKTLVDIIVPEGQLKENDIALFIRPSGKYVLHRVVKVNNDHYMICGDHQWQEERVPFDWVIGVVRRYYDGEKWISMDDPQYKKYVQSVPSRRQRLRIKHYLKQPLRFLKRTLIWK